MKWKQIKITFIKTISEITECHMTCSKPIETWTFVFKSTIFFINSQYILFQKGSIVCQKQACPVLNCPKDVIYTPNGTCCAVCSGKILNLFYFMLFYFINSFSWQYVLS
jgi:hypothetical protein